MVERTIRVVVKKGEGETEERLSFYIKPAEMSYVQKLLGQLQARTADKFDIRYF